MRLASPASHSIAAGSAVNHSSLDSATSSHGGIGLHLTKIKADAAQCLVLRLLIVGYVG